MTAPHDDWDDEERALLEGLDDQLHALRARHGGDPSLAALSAAVDDALPADLQSRVQAHLAASPWSRTVVEGATLPDTALDDVGEARILARVRQGVHGETPRTGWWPMSIMLGGALAASAVVTLLLWPRQAPELPGVDPRFPMASVSPLSPPPVSAPGPLPLDKPEVRLQLTSLTWRGAQEANPYVQELASAITAYRADDYQVAAQEFDTVAAGYPDAFEARFYGGISRLFLGDAHAALTALEAAAPLSEPDMSGEVQWYLSVAEQRAGRQDAAATRLRRVCRTGGIWGVRACGALAAWGDDAATARPPEPE